MTPDRSTATATERGPMEQWVFERCRWCWDGCSEDRPCNCDPMLCDDQARMRRDKPLFAFAREQDALQRDMLTALEAAYSHVLELREAWARGVLREGDGLGGSGIRSNRNVDVELAIRAILARAKGEQP